VFNTIDIELKHCLHQAIAICLLPAVTYTPAAGDYLLLLLTLLSLLQMLLCLCICPVFNARKLYIKLVAGLLVGTALEFYDFAGIYSTFGIHAYVCSLHTHVMSSLLMREPSCLLELSNLQQ
jgi:hypothetical protein